MLPRQRNTIAALTFRPGFTSSLCRWHIAGGIGTAMAYGHIVSAAAAALSHHHFTIADRQNWRPLRYRKIDAGGATRPVTGFRRRGLKFEETRNWRAVGKRIKPFARPVPLRSELTVFRTNRVIILASERKRTPSSWLCSRSVKHFARHHYRELIAFFSACGSPICHCIARSLRSLPYWSVSASRALATKLRAHGAFHRYGP